MKLRFEPGLDYQRLPIEAVADLFCGQEINRTEFTVTRRSLAERSGQSNLELGGFLGEQCPLGLVERGLGIWNRLTLLDDEILGNLKDVQLRNDLAPSTAISSGNFTVEMESGTGETYVYLRTIFELNQHYGFRCVGSDPVPPRSPRSPYTVDARDHRSSRQGHPREIDEPTRRSQSGDPAAGSRDRGLKSEPLSIESAPMPEIKKLDLNDPATRSADIIAGNIDALKALFPDAFTEGKIDFEVLKSLLGAAVDERDEKYGLNWHGKRRARQIALTPSTGTLLPCPEESVDWDTTQNLMIEGDNLEVLKLLQKSYAGKVKLIYIDPPYNTGKDFVYPDDFRDNIANYLELTGQVEGGRKINSNTELSGRFHTDWLVMMYPRLKLARTLLKYDGVVFVSIDDRELNHLRSLMNEIFGEENFVATISVVNNLKGRNDKKHVAACHEYVVVYSGKEFRSNGLPLTEEQRAAFKFVDEKGYKYALRDLRKRGGPDRREDRPNMFFPIYWDQASGRCHLERKAGSDIVILPMRGDGAEGCWRWGIDKVRQHLDWLHPKKSDRTGRLDVDHRLYLDTSIAIDDDADEEDEDDEGAIERTSKPKSIWLGGEFSTDNGKRSLKELLPGESFDFPKSIDFLRTCILLGTSGNEIVVDLFAGSGATGQALLQQNALDGKSRRYILVQLPEPFDPAEKSQKAAAAVCDKLGLKRHIAELTKERLRRAGSKIKAENPMFSGDTGFRVFKLASSNIRAWEPDPADLEKSLLKNSEHLVQGRKEQDVLYELLLKLGLDLCVPIEAKTIVGKAVYSIGGGALIVCLADGLTREVVEPLSAGIVSWRNALAPAVDTRVVFKDSGFADDIAKTNMASILNQNGISDVRSI